MLVVLSARSLDFIVGDSHQRIYRNYPTLSKCGINVRGRSSILKINYRTTEEIRKHAFALLNGISFDDLDEDLDLGDKCQSLTHGEKPIVENFENANDEFDFLLREVKKLKENGVSLTDICVVARTKKLVDDYIALFTRAGIRSYAIKRNKVDDRSFDGLRVATMHRVKLDLIRSNPNVCIEVESDVELISGGDVACKYGASFASVIGRGRAELTEDVQEKIRGLSLFMKNQTGREFNINEEMASTVEVIKVVISEFTAKSRSKA